MQKIKPALIITNRNKEDLMEQGNFLKKNKNIAIFSTSGIVETCQNMMKKERPFKIFINTGGKKLEYFYEILDFVTLMGGEGIQCPAEWIEYVYLSNINLYEKIKNYNFQFNPHKDNFEPIKTWFLITTLKKIDCSLSWENLRTINGKPLAIPNRIGFMYINDPIQ